jgi:hypothetical protein
MDAGDITPRSHGYKEKTQSGSICSDVIPGFVVCEKVGGEARGHWRLLLEVNNMVGPVAVVTKRPIDRRRIVGTVARVVTFLRTCN